MLVLISILVALTVLAFRFPKVTRVLLLMTPIAMVAGITFIFFVGSGMVGPSRQDAGGSSSVLAQPGSSPAHPG